MIYKDLKEILNSLSLEELNQTVTAYLTAEDEFVAVSSVLIESKTDRLDKGHIYFSV